MSCPHCWWKRQPKAADDTRPYVPLPCYLCGTMPPDWLACEECAGLGLLEPVYREDDLRRCPSCDGLGGRELRVKAVMA